MWLADRPLLYVDVPGIHDDVTDAGRLRLITLHATMQGLGLFGQSTRHVQRETIRRLVSELRGESVTGGVW